MREIKNDPMTVCADCGDELPYEGVVTRVEKDGCVRPVCGQCWYARRSPMLN